MEAVAGVITTITIAKPPSSSSSLFVRRLPTVVVPPNRERTKTITPKCLHVSSSPQPMAPPNNNTSSTTTTSTPKWVQRTLTLPPLPRGCHLITPQIVNGIKTDLSGFSCGLAHLFLQHTSASLTINENYDSDVRHDTETFLNNIVPEGPSAPWSHTLEGPDDMPAHIKSSMFGCALTIPITQGKLNMGTWQGIWLCEHRDYPTPRKLVVTLNGI